MIDYKKEIQQTINKFLINNKRLLLLAFLAISFHKFFESIIITTLLPFFDLYFHNNWITKISFLVLLGFPLFFFLFSKNKQHYFTNKRVVLFCLLIWMWAYYRNFEGWQYSTLYNFEKVNLTYLDLLICYPTIALIKIFLKKEAFIFRVRFTLIWKGYLILKRNTISLKKGFIFPKKDSNTIRSKTTLKKKGFISLKTEVVYIKKHPLYLQILSKYKGFENKSSIEKKTTTN